MQPWTMSHGVRWPLLTCPLPALEEAGNLAEPGRHHQHRLGSASPPSTTAILPFTLILPKYVVEYQPQLHQVHLGEDLDGHLPQNPVHLFQLPVSSGSTRQRTKTTRHPTGEVTESELLKDPKPAPHHGISSKVWAGHEPPARLFSTARTRRHLVIPNPAYTCHMHAPILWLLPVKLQWGSAMNRVPC